jgi:hypothetical protein
MIRSKCTLFALCLLVFVVAAPAFAQTSVSGDWDVTVISPQGENTTLCTFTQDGEKISGIFKSPQGQLPFEGGTLTGNDLKFTFTITTQGIQLPITLTGKVEGATMTGKADFGGFAEGDWSAKRTGGTAAAPTTASTTTTSTTTTTTTTATSTTMTSGVGAAGKWDVMLKTPGGDLPASATLTETDGKLTGTFGSQMGEVALTGSVEGKALKLSMTAQTPQGDMAVVLTGELDGDSIVNGKADVAGIGQMEWSAKRAKQ